MAIYTGCQKQIFCPTSNTFLPFLKDPPDKRSQHSQINFKILLDNIGWELRFSLLNQCLCIKTFV